MIWSILLWAFVGLFNASITSWFMSRWWRKRVDEARADASYYRNRMNWWANHAEQLAIKSISTRTATEQLDHFLKCDHCQHCTRRIVELQSKRN